MRRQPLLRLALVTAALTPLLGLPASSQKVNYGPGMATNASNATLPTAFSNLAAGGGIMHGTFLGDPIMGIYGAGFGTADTLASTWLDTYFPSAEIATTALSISPIGQVALGAATRDSDNAGAAGSSVIAHTVNVVSDSNTNWHKTWGNYLQSNLNGSAVGQHLQTESTIVNAWAPVTLDPYTQNAQGMTENMRLDCGIQIGATNCSSPLHVTLATAAYQSGIIFDNGSLANGSALQLPQGYSIDWFKSAGNKAWRLYSAANTVGLQTIVLGDWMTLSSPLVISSTSAATSHTTGSLVAGGGLGIGGKSFLADDVSLADSKFICFAGDAACTASNFAMFGASTQTVLNAPSGGFVDHRINNVSKLLVDSSGVTHAVGGLAAAGGFSVSPLNIGTCGVGHVSGAGTYTSQTPVATEVYIAEVFVPSNTTLTGVAVLNSATISGNMKVGLANSSGVNVATSASTAMSGASAYQRVAFTGTYAAVGPATYYVEVFYDNATARPNSLTTANCGAAKQTGQTYATGFTTISAPTTFTTALGPVAGLY